MNSIIIKAKDFATSAHQRIGHRRKYTRQPYEVHLKAVANLVAGVSEDHEMIAAAWLHDTVEDTAATHHDIEVAFGPAIAQMVRELTDVSKPSDGNRMTRKALDREHLAKASARAKTIKLADLIDNCRDICKHDQRFARVYGEEMKALLGVLQEGNIYLYQRAQKTLAECMESLGQEHAPFPLPLPEDNSALKAMGFTQRRVLRLFTEAFTAKDVAEPLHSYDAGRMATDVQKLMKKHHTQVAGIRHRGLVAGYVRAEDLDQGTALERARNFGRDQLVYGDASLSEVILVLTRYDYCFVTILETVIGIVTKSEIEKPVVRMWLFGMITMIEMNLADRIRQTWPEEAWTSLLATTRVEKAQSLYQERLRRNQHADLVDCLQLSDKGGILLKNSALLEEFGFQSKREAKFALKSLESLRNNLAHGQPISAQDWPQIVRMTQRLERLATAD